MGMHDVGLHYALLCVVLDVFPLSFRFRMATFHVVNSYMSDEDVLDIIASENSTLM